jgi:hypothetical protein
VNAAFPLVLFCGQLPHTCIDCLMHGVHSHGFRGGRYDALTHIPAAILRDRPNDAGARKKCGILTMDRREILLADGSARIEVENDDFNVSFGQNTRIAVLDHNDGARPTGGRRRTPPLLLPSDREQVSLGSTREARDNAFARTRQCGPWKGGAVAALRESSNDHSFRTDIADHVKSPL